MEGSSISSERMVNLKNSNGFLHKLQGVGNSITRYPVTVIFLFVAALLQGISIGSGKNVSNLFLICILGAILATLLQAIYERFFNQMVVRIVLMVIGILITLSYYFLVDAMKDRRLEISVRTFVIISALLVAFIWVPTIQSRFTFHESFMAAWKGFFQGMLFSIILFAGCSLILGALNLLLFKVNEKAYLYTGNIIFIVFAPIFFLALIPKLIREESDSKIEKVDSDSIIMKKEDGLKTKGIEILRDGSLEKAVRCPRFLEILISYIIIPLTAVFTLILIIYMIRNLSGELWTKNLLEPMMIGYSVTVIILYLLSSQLENKFAVQFRKIFPKILVPIVLVQVISSTLNLRDNGITHARYFVILFGIFTILSGIIMSVVTVNKNGYMAVIYLILAAISVIPPLDAFTLSKNSQRNLLEDTLRKNEMLQNDIVTPNSKISATDKERIASSMEYLNQLGYLSQLPWLGEKFDLYEDFGKTFGFNQYELPDKINQVTTAYFRSTEPIHIEGYEFFAHTYVSSDEMGESQIFHFVRNAQSYTAYKLKEGESSYIALRDSNKEELLRVSLEEVFTAFFNYGKENIELTEEEATFNYENEGVKMTLVVQEAHFNSSNNSRYYFVDMYILIGF